MTAVYIDSLALLNFIINYLLLLAAAKFCGAAFSRLRLALASGLGALYAVAVWLPGGLALAGLPGKLFSGLLMLAAAFAGKLRPGRFVKVCISFLAASFLLGGVVLILGMMAGVPRVGGIPYVPIDFKALFLTAGLSYALLTLAFRHAWRHGAAEKTELRVLWEGRELRLTALLDTGHTLQDPVSGRDVVIIEADAARSLLPPALRPFIERDLLRDPPGLLEAIGSVEGGTRFRLIPYRTVGVESGFLLAFRPDRVWIRNKMRSDCLVGLSPTALSAGAGIGAILSPN